MCVLAGRARRSVPAPSAPGSRCRPLTYKVRTRYVATQILYRGYRGGTCNTCRVVTHTLGIVEAPAPLDAPLIRNRAQVLALSPARANGGGAAAAPGGGRRGPDADPARGESPREIPKIRVRRKREPA